MTNYARCHALVEVAESSDFRVALRRISPPEFSLGSPTKQLIASPLASAAGTAVDLTSFTAITAMLIVNRSATAAEVVNAAWSHIRGSITSAIATPTAFVTATPDTITRAAADFVTQGAATGGYVRVTNSEVPIVGNDGRFLIQGAAPGTLTLAYSTTVDPNAADTTAVLTFERANYQGIPAGGYLFVTDNVQPLVDLVLYSESGTPSVDIFVVGT